MLSLFLLFIDNFLEPEAVFRFLVLLLLVFHNDKQDATHSHLLSQQHSISMNLIISASDKVEEQCKEIFGEAKTTVFSSQIVVQSFLMYLHAKDYFPTKTVLDFLEIT